MAHKLLDSTFMRLQNGNLVKIEMKSADRTLREMVTTPWLPVCGAECDVSPNYVCSLSKGHEGAHIAWAWHVVQIWLDDSTAELVEPISSIPISDNELKSAIQNIQQSLMES